MNFSTLVSSVVMSLAISSSAVAQWSNSGFSVGVAGSYNKTTLPNGQKITNNSLNWGVGLGGSSFNYPAYGGYGMGGYGMGGYGYGGAAVMPYYGGGCYPTVIPYSPFTRCYGSPMYAPQFPCAPAAVLPQAPVYW